MTNKSIVFSLTLLFVVFVIVFSASTYLGNNPLNKTLVRQRKFASILPEGWAFFTISAKFPRSYYYRLGADNRMNEIDLRNFSSKTAFGLSRDNRITGLQFSTVQSKIKSNFVGRTYTLKGFQITDIEKSFATDTIQFNILKVKEKLLPDLESGRYIIISQEMLPWSLLHRNEHRLSTFYVTPFTLEKY